MGLCASSPNADAVDTSKLENLVPEKKAPPRPGKQASTISAAAQVPPTAATQAVQPVHELHASKADKGPTDKGASNAVQDAFAGHISTSRRVKDEASSIPSTSSPRPKSFSPDANVGEDAPVSTDLWENANSVIDQNRQTGKRESKGDQDATADDVTMDGTAEVTKELAYGSGNMSLLYGARRDSRLSLDMGGSAINPSDLKGEIEAIEKDIRETSTLRKVMVSGKMMLNQYMVIKTLGKGNFGTVRLCFNLNDKKLYAIKTLNKKNLTRARGLRKRKDADPLADLKREVAIMKKLRHPNLVKLYEVIDDPVSTKLLMVMEHVQGGPIRSEKNGPSTMSEQVVVHYFRDMCMGLDYLHFNQIVHADLKPENMLLSAGGEVKITDFGCSRVLDEQGWVASKSTGTPMFHAPEMTTGKAYNAYSADIWALGVTLYVFIFGVMPFDGNTLSELHANIATRQLTFPSSMYVSEELKDLLTRMLEKDWTQRISLPDIMAHSWVTQGGMASINSLQLLQNPPPLISLISDAEESDAIRSDTCVALMQPCFEEVVFENGEHLIRAGEAHDVVFYICSGQCEVVQMVSSMRPDTSARDTCEHTGTVESAMFSQDDWSCVDVANPNSSIVDNMYQSLDKMQVVHFEHVVRTLSCGSFVGNVEQLDVMEYFSENVSVIAKGQVTTLAIQKNDLVEFLASRPEVEKVIRGKIAQAKTDKLVHDHFSKFTKELSRGKP